MRWLLSVLCLVSVIGAVVFYSRAYAAANPAYAHSIVGTWTSSNFTTGKVTERFVFGGDGSYGYECKWVNKKKGEQRVVQTGTYKLAPNGHLTTEETPSTRYSGGKLLFAGKGTGEMDYELSWIDSNRFHLVSEGFGGLQLRRISTAVAKLEL